MEKDILCKWNPKENRGSYTYIWQKDFKPKSVTRDEEGNYITIKGSIHEQYITIVNRYEPKFWAPRYIKQILTDLKGEKDNNTITVGNFNIALSALKGRSFRQKINK